MRPAKTQISLGIRPVWSESSLCAQWVAKNQSFLHADSEDCDQSRRMPRLIWVFAGCTLILLVLSCRGSYRLLSTEAFWYYRRICRIYKLLWFGFAYEPINPKPNIVTVVGGVAFRGRGGKQYRNTLLQQGVFRACSNDEYVNIIWSKNYQYVGFWYLSPIVIFIWNGHANIFEERRATSSWILPKIWLSVETLF